MQMRKLFAGVAALATLLGGLALGASTANAVETPSYPQLGTTIELRGSEASLVGRTFKVYKLADYEQYQGATTVGLKTNGWQDGVVHDKQSESVKEIQDALNKANDQYPADSNEDPLAWSAQKQGRLDNGVQSTENPWLGLTRTFAEQLDITKLGEPAKTVSDLTAQDLQGVIGQPGSDTDTFSYTVTNLEPGLYLVVDTTEANDTTSADQKDPTKQNEEWTNSLKMVLGTKLVVSEDGITEKVLADGVINLKNQTLPVYKQVVQGNKNDGYTSDTTPDFNIGDEVTYELTTKIPTYTGYEKDSDNPYTGTNRRVLQVIDKMSAGLTFKSIESVTVTKGDETKTLVKNTYNAHNDYSVTNEAAKYTDNAAANNATKVTIDLGGYVNQTPTATSVKDGKILEGGTVKVILKAELNKDALISIPGNVQANPNKVELTYSNNPDNIEDKTTILAVRSMSTPSSSRSKSTPRTPARTFRWRVLSSWCPRLWRWYPAAQTVYMKTTTETDANGKKVSKVEWVNEADATKFASDEKGLVSGLDGLAATDADGNVINYKVTEVKAPADYQSTILPSFDFTITPNYVADESTKDPSAQTWGDQVAQDTKDADGKVTVSAVEYSGDEGDAWSLVSKDGEVTYQYNVLNVKNVFELPKTGAAGIAMFGVIAALLAGASITVYMKSRATKRALRA
ncbi:putative LPXTG-motif protein cell wall anchor domain protein [Bifidobacterium reuteri DSM 23975]|uniref:Putative LPXTG-motif protein cell wall anchor domain protein n=1 Tax=Bifidobacterium reuteri DSM 23975 TaxID=1437610 RepID=A0A087CL07_9BIFI|nr:isopeptide-forming domain-containing fimbrial protein [Bifidobacterium reuteri]KFI83957.1 putative LPXTG-motif protein cell wall anchor domain protein [Bifidobacterium reuteri DSM 23975]